MMSLDARCDTVHHLPEHTMRNNNTTTSTETDSRDLNLFTKELKRLRFLPLAARKLVSLSAFCAWRIFLK